MEPISAVALSLALGAGATAGKEVIGGLVKDAYTALKDLIKNRYPQVSLEQLEQALGETLPVDRRIRGQVRVEITHRAVHLREQRHRRDALPCAREPVGDVRHLLAQRRG